MWLESITMISDDRNFKIKDKNNQHNNYVKYLISK